LAERRVMRWAAGKVCMWEGSVVCETAGQWADSMDTNSERGKGKQSAGWMDEQRELATAEHSDSCSAGSKGNWTVELMVSIKVDLLGR
jgi:hypothetical protein